MSEWKECRLGDMCNIRRGSSPRPIQNFLSETGMPWIKIADATATDSPYISKTKQCIIPEGIKGSVEVHPGDFIVSNSATPGLPRFVEIDACIHDGWLLLSDLIGIDKWFLFYKFYQIRNTLVNQANGSVFQNLKTDIVKDFIIKLPPLAEQKKIAGILSALDEKIETNRKINARLEELAQALFKSWFIDFEPFGGQMPEDWKNVTLSDIGDIIGGATPSKEHSEYYAKVGNGIAWLTPKDLSETNAKFTARGSLDITNLGYQKCSTKLIPCGSILFSSRAPIGYVSIALNEICTNQGFKSFIPKQVGTAFSYYLLKTLTPEIENKSTGSTFKEASGSLMKSLQVFLPDKETLSRFEEICTPIFDKQRDCEIESTRLAELRDSLLPKLMSGELIPE